MLATSLLLTPLWLLRVVLIVRERARPLERQGLNVFFLRLSVCLLSGARRLVERASLANPTPLAFRATRQPLHPLHAQLVQPSPLELQATR